MHSTFEDVQLQSAASDDGDDPSSSDGPSRSGGLWAAATGSLVHNYNPPGKGRKA